LIKQVSVCFLLVSQATIVSYAYDNVPSSKLASTPTPVYFHRRAGH
jgi:hypothetical protein